MMYKLFWVLTNFMIFFFLLSMFMSTLSFFMKMKSLIINLSYTLFELNSAHFSMDFQMDWKMAILSAIISFITANIFLYSNNYMNMDQKKIRFTYILMFFALSMLWTVMSSKNSNTILIGWDYLGLTSLLLIMHYQSKYVFNYSILTFILNRLGDIAFIMAGAYMFSKGDWLFYNINEFKYIIMSFLYIAVFTKSAMMPFSSWLPKAMAAPTPVSALVHSSTLVTAGMVLMLSLWPLSASPMITYSFIIMCTFTLVVSSLTASFCNDLKKIIAYSTMSQISLMLIILMLGMPFLAFIHLLTHAIFKSLMFLAAGSIIFHLGGEQDIRKMSNIFKSIPMESIMMIIAILTLMGFPYLSGFYSKDPIIEFYNNEIFNKLIIYLTDLGIILTSVYSYRLMYFLFLKKSLQQNMFMWSFSKEEISTMIIYMIPVIMFGSLLSYSLFKNFMIEYLLPYPKKLFGFMSIIVTVSCFIPLYKNLSGMNFKLNYIMSNLFLIEFLLQFMKENFLKMSNWYMNYVENLWNKYLPINLLMEMIMIFKIPNMFSPWNLISFSIISVTCLSLFILI